MASDENTTDEWSWSSWIWSAKEKSLAALNATKRDLAEFVNVVQEDTTTAVSGAATKVKQIINKEEQIDGGDSGGSNKTDCGHNQQEADKNVSYDRTLTHLEMMRSDPTTYCTIPEGKSGEFLEWSKDFDLSTQQDEISRLLVASASVRKLHSALVPAKVSYESFWFNYFYRVHLMDKTEAHRAEIMARVHSQGQLICWDDDDELLTEEKPEDVIIVKRDVSDDKAMTDSTESFVCINEEEGTDNTNEEGEGLVINNKELVIKDQSGKEEGNVVSDSKDKDGSDDDWERWNDD